MTHPALTVLDGVRWHSTEVVERAGGGYRLGLEAPDVDALELDRLGGAARRPRGEVR